MTRSMPAAARGRTTRRLRTLLVAVALPLVALAGTTLGAAPAAYAGPPSGSVLDQSNETGPSLLNYEIPGNILSRAQTFKAGKSGMLTAVDVNLVYLNPNQTQGVTTVSIMRTTPSGAPDGVVLASGTVAAGFLGATTVDVSPAIPVIAGDEYAIDLSSTHFIEPGVYSPANYSDGALYVSSGSGYSPASQSASYYFATYVDQTANAAPSVSGVPDATIINGRPFSFSYTVGGSPAPDVTLASGTLPTGLTLSNSGVLSGTPTANGPFNFTVKAANGVGTDATIASAISVRDPKVPAAPTIGAVTTSNHQADVNFTPPGDTGDSPITSYIVTSSPGGITATGTSSPISVTGLTNGTAYTFTVQAKSIVGTGPDSDASDPATPSTIPDAPTHLSATPLSQQVELSWDAPSDGGATIADYLIQVSTDGHTWADADTTSGTSDTISSLTNGTPYYFQVEARNTNGPSAYSANATATPRTTPDFPTWVSLIAGDGQATLTWTAPSDGGSAITGYTVEESTDLSHWSIAATTTTALSTVVSSLDNGTEYYFEVFATNAAGDGSASVASSVVPRTTPGAPTFDTATPGDGSVSLTWDPPSSNGGDDVIGYDIRYSTDGSNWTDAPTPTGTSTTVGGLDNGTQYSFEVRAENGAGPGNWSADATATPRTTADAPTALQATATDGAVSLTWTAPAVNGGAPITGYDIQYRKTGAPIWADGPTGASSPATMSGLTNGTSYDFRIAAVNAAGTGTWSDAIRAVPFVLVVSFDTSSGHSVAGKTLSAGDDVTISASDLPPGATLTVVLHSAPVTVGTAVVASDGTVSLDATIPAATASGAHELVATLAGAGVTTTSASVAFRVAANSLAFTGSTAPWLTGSAALVLLFGAGGVLLLVKRRRRAL